MSDIFLSYASEDRERAQALAAVLREQGWTVWWDRTIPPGRTFDEVIEEALDGARCVMVIWSASSVTSHWVKAEAAEGLRRGVLVPVLLEPVRIPLEFRRVQAADLSAWHGNREHSSLEQLFTAVTDLLSSAPRTGTGAWDRKRKASRETSANDPGSTPPSKRRWALGLAVILLCAAAAGGWFLIPQQKDTPRSDAAKPPDPVPPAADPTPPPVASGSPSGPANAITVPSVVGLNESEARRRLTSAGLKSGGVTRRPSPTVPPGRVMEQNPAAGQTVSPGDQVRLVVSRAPPLVVPDVVGRTPDDARAAIEDAGLVLSSVESRLDTSTKRLSVVLQTPPAGTPAKKGDPVTLTVARPAVVVPSVIGLTEAAARASLQSAGLVVGKIAQVEDATRPGTVIRQGIAADKEVEPGARVDLTVAVARPPTPPTVGFVEVPDVFGLTEDAARALLQKRGLVAGRIERLESPARAGTVVDQSIRPATRVPPRTRIDLRVAVARTPAPPTDSVIEFGDFTTSVPSRSELVVKVTFRYSGQWGRDLVVLACPLGDDERQTADVPCARVAFPGESAGTLIFPTMRMQRAQTPAPDGRQQRASTVIRLCLYARDRGERSCQTFPHRQTWIM